MSVRFYEGRQSDYSASVSDHTETQLRDYKHDIFQSINGREVDSVVS